MTVPVMAILELVRAVLQTDDDVTQPDCSELLEVDPVIELKN